MAIPADGWGRVQSSSAGNTVAELVSNNRKGNGLAVPNKYVVHLCKVAGAVGIGMQHSRKKPRREGGAGGLLPPRRTTPRATVPLFDPCSYLLRELFRRELCWRELSCGALRGGGSDRRQRLHWPARMLLVIVYVQVVIAARHLVLEPHGGHALCGATAHWCCPGRARRLERAEH